MSAKHTVQVPLRAYTLDNNPLPFSRATFYRWEALGLIPLLRVAGKTLISSETVEDILAGKVALPHNHGMVVPPQPRVRRGRSKTQPQPSASPAE